MQQRRHEGFLWTFSSRAVSREIDEDSPVGGVPICLRAVSREIDEDSAVDGVTISSSAVSREIDEDSAANGKLLLLELFHEKLMRTQQLIACLFVL